MTDLTPATDWWAVYEATGETTFREPVAAFVDSGESTRAYVAGSDGQLVPVNSSVLTLWRDGESVCQCMSPAPAYDDDDWCPKCSAEIRWG